MNTFPIQEVVFDHEATRLMGAAYDQACTSLRRYGYVVAVREIIAKRIIEAATNGERNPIRLYRSALKPFGIEPPVSMPTDSVDRNPPVPVYASIARVA